MKYLDALLLKALFRVMVFVYRDQAGDQVLHLLFRFVLYNPSEQPSEPELTETHGFVPSPSSPTSPLTSSSRA